MGKDRRTLTIGGTRFHAIVGSFSREEAKKVARGFRKRTPAQIKQGTKKRAVIRGRVRINSATGRKYMSYTVYTT